LGAHIAGLTGKTVTRGRVRTIIGLDPTGSGFSLNAPQNRLADTDADYVEVIHTNGCNWFGNGFGDAIGHADFFPNGGCDQPGCLFSGCSHNRAVALYGKLTQLQSFTFIIYKCFQQSNQ